MKIGFKKKVLKGFSLGEILLASFVLTAGLVSTMGLIASSFQHSVDSRDTIIAAELAQEGIELVRNVRDNDFTNGGTGFTAFDANKKHCRIDYNDSFIFSLPATNLDCETNQGSVSRYTLRYSNGMYTHANTAEERFSRYVYINYDGSDSATIRSFVYWGVFVPTGSNPSTCKESNRCVFDEVTFTAWR